MAVKLRTEERGAALFIVVMVVTLLTAIGAFAMHATSLAQLGSGYSRRAATAFYLAELAANLRFAVIADDTTGYQARGDLHQDSCLESLALNPQLPTNAPIFCVAMDTAEAANDATQSIPSLAADPEGFFGALSRPDAPLGQTMNATIRVESTDHHPSPYMVEGAAVDGKTQVWQDALTVKATLLPAGVLANSCTADFMRASETQRLRGFVTYVVPRQ